MNTAQFIIKSKLIHDNKYDYSLSIYINTRTKIKIKCNICKIIFEQKPYNHLYGQGCKQCYIFSKNLTNDEFIEKSKKIHKNTFDYSLTKYIDHKTKIIIICKLCDTVFEQFPGNNLQGYSCKRCYINNITFSKEEFINKAIQIHKDKYDYSLVEYVNSFTKIKIKCNICKDIFDQTPDSHFRSNCLNCENIKKRKTLNEFINKSIKIHNNIYDYKLVEYINSTTLVKKCNNIFNQTPNLHYNSGCPRCQFSKGELKCQKILERNKNVFDIQSQYRFIDCRNKLPLPFDFKIILNNTKYFLIEYQGKQHYEENTFFSDSLLNIQKRDCIKKTYCKENNINLLVIKYLYFDNIENIINSYIERIINIKNY